MGGIEGNSGNPGYSTQVNGVINLAGGINQLTWINQNDVPMVSCHGNADNTVPYNCDDVLQSLGGSFFNLVDLCGSGAMKTWCDNVNTDNPLLTFPGDNHVPWENNTAKMNQMINFVVDFLVAKTVCDTSSITSVSGLNANTDLIVSPNPVSDIIRVQVNNPANGGKIRVFNSIGRLVAENSIIGINTTWDMSFLTSGTYFINVLNGKQVYGRLIVKQ